MTRQFFYCIYFYINSFLFSLIMFYLGNVRYWRLNYSLYYGWQNDTKYTQLWRAWFPPEYAAKFIKQTKYFSFFKLKFTYFDWGGDCASKEPDPLLLRGGRGAEGLLSTPDAERVAGAPSAESTRAETSAASGQC